MCDLSLRVTHNLGDSFHICDFFFFFFFFFFTFIAILRLPNGYKCKNGHKCEKPAVTNVKCMFSLNQN